MTQSPPRAPGAVDPDIAARGYARPEVLVSTAWLAEHLDDPGVRVLESDEDVLLYDTGHIPGALKLDWHTDLNDPLVRDYVDPAAFEAVVRSRGIDDSMMVVMYGDRSNWWATYAFWVFKLFEFPNVKILDGGRAKWEAEGRPFTTEVRQYQTTRYRAPERRDRPIRAFMDDVKRHVQEGRPLVDVRSPDEYSGRTLHMPDYPQEGALRGGHIPRAKNVPWSRAANPDGTFRSRDELAAIYEREQKLSEADDVIAYCRIGERSSHTWFVLRYLLGYPRVRNYDGSWTEWGNAVRAPIER